MACSNTQANVNFVLPEGKEVKATCENFSDTNFETFISEQVQLFSDTWDNAVDPVDLNVLHKLPSGDWNKQTEETCIDSDGIQSVELSTLFFETLDRSEYGTLDFDMGENFTVEEMFPCIGHVEDFEKTYTNSYEQYHSLPEGVEAKEDTLNSHGPVTAVNMEVRVSPYTKIPDSSVGEFVDEVSTSCSNGSEVGNTKTNGNHEIDWEDEKNSIVSRMLGKYAARSTLVEEQLQHIVEEFQNYWKNNVSNAVPIEGRSLRCFQRKITLILNSYCEQEEKKVKYLPDFCKKALSEWIAIEAHYQNPYPQKIEIQRLAKKLGLRSTQVEQWFQNYRVRNWKPEKTGLRKGKFFQYPYETTEILKNWIVNNKDDPKPQGKDLKSLTKMTGMTGTQIKQWCYNFQRRQKSVIL